MPWYLDRYLYESVGGDPARQGLRHIGARAKAYGSELELEGSIDMHANGHVVQHKIARRLADEARLNRGGRGKERRHGQIVNLERLRRYDSMGQSGSHWMSARGYSGCSVRVSTRCSAESVA